MTDHASFDDSFRLVVDRSVLSLRIQTMDLLKDAT